LNYIEPYRKLKAWILQPKDTRFTWLMYRTSELCQRVTIAMAAAIMEDGIQRKLLNLPIDMVETERAHIHRHNQRRRKFLATGDLDLPQLPGTPTVYTIFQK
jgi:hypothetical protein